MFEDHNIKNVEEKISYSSYEREVKKLNISFTRLSAEECSMCKTLALSHVKVAGTRDCVPDCDACIRQGQRDQLKAEAWATYKSDVSEVKQNTIVRSVDLQKVIMLPTLPGVKSVCFTRRIVAFHETFVPVDKYKTETPTFSCIWHEGISFSKAEDIASTFVHALRQDRDKVTIIYFSDNCSAQNKNWYLFSELANTIN